MSPRTPQEIKLDSLVAQLNLFEALQVSHEVWVANTDDPETEHLHHEIIELIERLREKYAFLLDKYNYRPREITP